MGYMKARARRFGKVNGKLGAVVACFLAAYVHVAAYVGVVTAIGFCFLHVAVYDVGVLAMGHDGHWGC